MEQSESTSAIQSETEKSDARLALGYEVKDILAARAMVKYLVGQGRWSGRTDLFMLPDSEIERWIDGQAVVYLDAQAKRRRGERVDEPKEKSPLILPPGVA